MYTHLVLPRIFGGLLGVEGFYVDFMYSRGRKFVNLKGRSATPLTNLRSAAGVVQRLLRIHI